MAPGSECYDVSTAPTYAPACAARVPPIASAVIVLEYRQTRGYTRRLYAIEGSMRDALGRFALVAAAAPPSMARIPTPLPE